MTLPIALQLYTVRDVLTHDLDAGLAAVADIGFKNVELAGLYGQTSEAMKTLLDKHGLTAIAAHDMWVSDKVDPTDAINAAKAIGYAYVVQPYWPDDKRVAAEYQRYVDAATSQSAQGITFAYHNHDFEFETLDNGKTAMEMIFEGTGLVSELDSCWSAVAGADTVAWMKKLAGRLPLLHIKDCSDFDAKTLCEIGTGKVPIRDFLAAAPECGVKHLVVEQDNNWIDGDPLKSARLSYENLRGMLA